LQTSDEPPVFDGWLFLYRLDAEQFVGGDAGRRIQKQCVAILDGETTTTTTQYVYDGEDIVLQLQTITYDDATLATTTTETRFIRGPGIDEPLAMIEDGDSYFYHADGLGSIIAMTDDTLNIVQHYSYDSFGMPTLSDPDFSQPYAFTGREWDDETELYFYRARYYDSSAGRFISKDPIGFNGGDVTLYGYVGDNPVNLIDPYGLWPFGLPGKGDAIQNGPSWVNYYLPSLTEAQKENLVNEVVDEIGWGDITSGTSTFGTNFQPPKPEELHELKPGQKEFIQNFIDRIDVDEAIKKRIGDLLNPSRENKDKQQCP